MAKTEKIVGYCPMGCGQTLFLGAGGHVTCSRLACPRPTAVDELLDIRETEHVVVFTETNFTVQHPVRERLDGDLFTCQLHRWIADHGGPPVKPGRYRATGSAEDGWGFEEVPDA